MSTSAIVFLVIITLFLLFAIPIMRENAKVEQEEKEKRRRKRERDREEKDQKLKEILDAREQKYGNLTQAVDVNSNKEDSLYIYETAQKLFIYGKEYSFSDILSCYVDKELYKKGTTTTITQPDSGEMAAQEVLWGMGKSYNVKSTSTTQSTPDKYRFVIYIGINSIDNPQVKITRYSMEDAKKIENLMQTIINYSKAE